MPVESLDACRLHTHADGSPPPSACTQQLNAPMSYSTCLEHPSALHTAAPSSEASIGALQASERMVRFSRRQGSIHWSIAQIIHRMMCTCSTMCSAQASLTMPRCRCTPALISLRAAFLSDATYIGETDHLQHEVLGVGLLDHAAPKVHARLDELARRVLPQPLVEAAQQLAGLNHHHPGCSMRRPLNNMHIRRKHGAV